MRSVGSTASLIRSVNDTSVPSFETLERSSQYDFCVSKRDQGSTLSAMPSSGIESITICSDKTDDLIQTGSPRPLTAPSPSGGLVSRSRVIRVTTPTQPKSKFEIEQNAFEQWLVNKLKAEDEKRKEEQEREKLENKIKCEKAEKAKWAHIDWVKQKEDAEKQKAEKLKRKNALLEKKKLQNHEAKVKRKQEAEEKFKKWLEAKNEARKAERERRDKQILKERKENEMKKQISEAKFKEWLRKNNQTNPDIKPQVKPRDTRWTDPTPTLHPETVRAKARPNSAPPKRDFFTVRDSRCFIQWR